MTSVADTCNAGDWSEVAVRCGHVITNLAFSGLADDDALNVLLDRAVGRLCAY